MKMIKGFTIIEVMVAVILIALVAIAAFEFFRYCQRFIVDSELQLIAINYARETMEEHYWEVAPGTEDATLPQGVLPGGLRTYSVSNDNETSPNYRIITVTVGWD